MTYKQAVRGFEEAYRKLYISRADYCTAQLAWACYVDCLNKDGQITDRQAFRWQTPFKGKHLTPKKWQLEMEVREK